MVTATATLVRNYLEVNWLCAGGLSAVNAIGTQLRDPTSSGPIRWRLAVLNIRMDTAAEIGRNPVSKHQIQPEFRDEQADAGQDGRTRLARPNFSGANADREIFIFPTCSIGNLTRFIHTLAICDDHTHILLYPSV